MLLADFRAEQGLTLEQTALALGLSASSGSWLSEIENGRREASLRLALRIERWSGGKVRAGSVCSELAEHGEALGSDGAIKPEPFSDGAEKDGANISGTSAPAFSDATSTQQISKADPVEAADGRDPVVGSVAGNADHAASEGQINQRLSGLAATGRVELVRPEIGQPNLHPARAADPADRLDAEAVAVADVDDGAAEGLARSQFGRHRTAIGNASAWVGQSRAGDESDAQGECDSEHADRLARTGAAA
jgi:transcriptional regulator with XRE-family HTH domain